MDDGLIIGPKEFEKLPTKQQLSLLYENTEELKKMVGAYKFTQKVQYGWLYGLTILIFIAAGWKELLGLF